MKKWIYFCVMLFIPMVVLGADAVEDKALREKKQESLDLKKQIFDSAQKIKEYQIKIKRGLIGCRLECDYCKDAKQKLDIDGNVDAGCEEGGYSSKDYACQRQEDCMEKYKKHLKKEESVTMQINDEGDNKKKALRRFKFKEDTIFGKQDDNNTAGTYVTDEKTGAFLTGSYVAVMNQIAGAAEASKKEFHRDYPPKQKHPPEPKEWPISDQRKKESVLFAAFRNRMALPWYDQFSDRANAEKTVEGYARSNASPAEKVAFFSMPHSDILAKYSEVSNKNDKLEVMKDQIRRTYFHDKTGCYGDDECYKKYREESDENRKKLSGADDYMETLYLTARGSYLKELSIDSLSLFAAVQESQFNNKEGDKYFYENPQITVNEKWGGSYLDDILYNNQLMRALCAQTTMEMLMELRLLELTVARSLFDSDIDLAVHPAYLDRFLKEYKPDDADNSKKQPEMKTWIKNG